VHLHELIYYITGLSPIEVIADQSSYGFFDVVDNTTCLTRYTNNVQGQFWFSKAAIGHRNGLKLRIYGTEGSIEWYQGNPEELSVSYSDGRKVMIDRASFVHVADDNRYSRFKAGHPAGFNEALANLYADFHHSIIDYQKNITLDSSEVFGVDLALEGMLWLEAMQKSITSHKWEKINK
jgi:predicted dehydrogenase